MSFLYPAFLIGAVAVALPIVLHFLRRDEAPDVPFSAVRLLRQSPVERARRRRLRDILLLAARVAALLLLAAAFARPYVQGAAPSPVRVVAIDRSYSMGGAGRFERALDLARAAVDDAAGARVAVVAFDTRAETIAMPGGAGEARAALSKVSAGSGGTNYRALLDAVRDLAGGAPGRLVMVTDLQQSGWEGEPRPSLPPGWTVEVRDVGAAPPNVAVTALRVERDTIVATVRNGGSDPRRGRIRGVADGRTVSEAEYAVEPRESREVALPLPPSAPPALTVAIDDGEGLAPDNERHLVLGAGGAPKTLVIASGDRPGFYVSRALQTSLGEDGAIEAEVVAGTRLSSMTPDELRGYAALALLSTRGLDRKGRDTLAAQVRGGAGLFVAASPDLEIDVLRSLADWDPPLEIVAQGEQRLTLAATDLRHPIFRPFGALAANLGQARFERTWQVAPAGWVVVARFSNGSPALLERALGRGRVVLFASDVDRRWNDLPLHPGFVPFAIEAIRHAGAGRPAAREYVAGQTPDGVGPNPGIYRVGGGLAAVNVDPAEGLAARVPEETFAQLAQQTTSTAVAAAAAVQARQTESRQSYWQYGLLVMIAALVAESFVGRL
jgi:hypothetical protein